MPRATVYPKAPAQAGFTLVELLIAISLLGLIAIVTYSAVWTASRSLRAVEARVAVSDEFRVTQDFLRQALSQTRGVMAVKDDLMQVVFVGEQRTLAFVAPAPLQGGSAGGLYRYRLDLRGNGNGEEGLRLSYWQYLAGVEFDEEREPQGEVFLISNVEKLIFSFYGSAQPGADASWAEEWLRTDGLPQLVRIGFKKRDSDRVTMMTVAIKGGGG